MIELFKLLFVSWLARDTYLWLPKLAKAMLRFWARRLLPQPIVCKLLEGWEADLEQFTGNLEKLGFVIWMVPGVVRIRIDQRQNGVCCPALLTLKTSSDLFVIVAVGFIFLQISQYIAGFNLYWVTLAGYFLVATVLVIWVWLFCKSSRAIYKMNEQANQLNATASNIQSILEACKPEDFDNLLPEMILITEEMRKQNNRTIELVNSAAHLIGSNISTVQSVEIVAIAERIGESVDTLHRWLANSGRRS